MLPGPTPSSFARRGKGTARRLHRAFLYLGCTAFVTLAALFYGVDAFFWVLRHSRAIRGSCLPRPSANPLYASPPSFAVLSFHHQENSDLRAVTMKNHESYCRRHGYTCIDGYDWYISRCASTSATDALPMHHRKRLKRFLFIELPAQHCFVLVHPLTMTFSHIHCLPQVLPATGEDMGQDTLHPARYDPGGNQKR